MTTTVVPTTDTITAQVEPSDDAGSVSKVDLLVDDVVKETKTVAPYTFTLSLPAGQHTLVAKATDAGDLTGTSEPITITVSAPNLPPTISLDSPQNNAVFTAPANLTRAIPRLAGAGCRCRCAPGWRLPSVLSPTFRRLLPLSGAGPVLGKRLPSTSAFTQRDW